MSGGAQTQAIRTGRLVRVFIYCFLLVAVLFYLLYWNLLVLAKNLMKDGTTPAWLGLWWSHLPMVAILVLLILFRSGKLRLPRRASS